MNLEQQDKAIFNIIGEEKKRQTEGLEMIASENYVSEAVLEATGSILTNKYAEGYPGARYYGGCEFVDQIENLAIERAKALFGCEFVNVQPHSGSSANAAAYGAVLQPGDKILGQSLDAGGHLTHGSKVSFSGKIYQSFSYSLNSETGLLDYDDILKIAKDVRPKVIMCGFSAYPRKIDFKMFRKIADEVGAILIADIAHIAGLVATGYHESPIGVADIVTSTTHKTLRGPRSGIIMTNSPELIKKINSAVFPMLQGGPLEHVIAAKAVSFGEALEPEYKVYQSQVKSNAAAIAKAFTDGGYKIISGGTDNHSMLIDLRTKFPELTGKVAEKALVAADITVNKNMVPFDSRSPFLTSGIRVGTPAITTRGAKEA